MGYYIDAVGIDWVVPEREDLLATIKEMPKRMKRIQRGGVVGPEREEKWFSWVNDDEILNAKSVRAVYQAFGFDTATAEGGFEISGYSSKVGQEELLLAVSAPFCAEGSYIEFRGEDGAEWRYIVEDGKMKRSEATTTWDEPRDYVYFHFGSLRDVEGFYSYSADIDINGDIEAQVALAEEQARKRYIEERSANV